MVDQVRVITFGCRLNTYESAVIKKNAQAAGLSNTIIINTCAVTSTAEKQARQAIRQAKKNNPGSNIIVTGCAAQNNPMSFVEMKEVDKVIGNQEKLLSTHYQIDNNKVVVDDITKIRETTPHLVSSFDGKTRAFIEIQNGCDHRCTFCIIPFVRGNNRSVPIGIIVEQITTLVAAGYNEIVFTGVDITAYGQDLPGMPTLAQMIKRVMRLVPALKRLRLSSIDVAEIDDELFELMAYMPRLMPHFHVSIQSGDDMILKRMKRRHSRQQVIDFCHRLRDLRSEVSFGADLIAGFPTETDSMFTNSKSLISEAGLQYVHVFPYSIRAGTPAARMPQVKLSVIKERAAILRNEGKKQLHKFFTERIGDYVELLCEQKQLARTANFIPVQLENTQYQAGAFVHARLTSVHDQYMKAQIFHAGS